MIEVHTIGAPQRRMLLELLAGERAGEDALRVGAYAGRALVARTLSTMKMAWWCDQEHVALTDLGRHIAESLAQRLVSTPIPQAC